MLLQVSLCQAAAPEWLIATDQPAVVAGNTFEIIVAGTGGEPLPDEIEVRLRTEIEQRVLVLRALRPAENGRRSYAGELPASMSGNIIGTMNGLIRSGPRVCITTAASTMVLMPPIPLPTSTPTSSALSEQTFRPESASASWAAGHCIR